MVWRSIVLASHPSSVKSGNERPIARLFHNARFAKLDSSDYVRVSRNLFFLRIRCLAPIESCSKYTTEKDDADNGNERHARVWKNWKINWASVNRFPITRLAVHALLTVFSSRCRVSLLRFAVVSPFTNFYRYTFSRYYRNRNTAAWPTYTRFTVVRSYYP